MAHPKKKKILTKIKILQEQLQSILNEEVQEKIRFLSQRYFEGVDKPGKFLARLIKKQRGKAIITKIKIDNAEIVDHQTIKKMFTSFFKISIRRKYLKRMKLGNI